MLRAVRPEVSDTQMCVMHSESRQVIDPSEVDQRMHSKVRPDESGFWKTGYPEPSLSWRPAQALY